jgi:hypothetical protein
MVRHVINQVRDSFLSLARGTGRPPVGVSPVLGFRDTRYTKPTDSRSACFARRQAKAKGTVLFV